MPTGDAKAVRADLCIIGASPAGLAAASAAAALGADVTLVEHPRPGTHGYGVAASALMAAACALKQARQAPRFGLHVLPPQADGRAVLRRVRAVMAELAPKTAMTRYNALGVRCIPGPARFLDDRIVGAGDLRIAARRIIIATGAVPAVPDISGLGDGPFLTPDTIFDLQIPPQRLAIIGAGPVACQLAQAFARLGSDVLLVAPDGLLPDADADARHVLRLTLLADGVDLRENEEIARVDYGTFGGRLILAGAAPLIWSFDGLLLAVGTTPDLATLDLDRAGIAATTGGITVSGALRTSNRRVHAIGDCVEGGSSQHAATHQAGLVVRAALLGLPATYRPDLVPKVTFTDPQIVHIGMTGPQAHLEDTMTRTIRMPLSETDQARIEGQTTGFVKLVLDRRRRIRGATIVAPGASDMIVPWALAIRQRLRADEIATLAFPWPAASDATRQAALQGLAGLVQNPWLRRLMRLMRLFR